MGKWILVCGFLAATPVMADTLNTGTPFVSTENSDVKTPRASMTMDQVTAEFGEPEKKHEAVGIPPITRWDYAGFSVFFENKRVLHSVVHDSSTK
ncbi:MAG: hypothetical protein EP315_08035 [Gammaproteobacteria bacterium]|nr:MAG: hypothetical protein EP315_08035 [Gammaproteobacteria bacterium]